jgi:hypothetical protein
MGWGGLGGGGGLGVARAQQEDRIGSACSEARIAREKPIRGNAKPDKEASKAGHHRAET